MSADAAELAAAAREAALGAYAPYSNFRVGAVVVAADGSRHAGANVENAAYGSSVCAEATAVVGAVAAGVRSIDTVAVACIDATDMASTYPCGNCRQIMHEFGVRRVVIAGPAGEIVEHDFEDLHPHGFVL